MDKYFVLVPDIAVRIPDITVHIPDITVPIPDINLIEKWLSGTWTEKTGHIPDIKNRCQGYGQLKLAISRTSLTFSVHIPDITVYIPDITVLVLDITVLIPDIIVHIPDIIFSLLSTFRTSKVDVRNMDSILCPCSGHQRLMSGTWTVFSVHVPDIKYRCPE